MDSYSPIIICKRSLFLLVCAVVILTAGRMSSADETRQNNAEPAMKIRKSYAPYCGLYCIYTVLKLAGQEIDFSKLYKSEYLSSFKGSSLAELKKATEDCGLYAVSVSKLALRDLQQADYPIILHVKSEIGSAQYDHYKLFLGTKVGNARILDPLFPVCSVPFSELAPCWDGKGLIVSTKPIKLGAVLAPTRKRLVIYATIVSAIILIVHLARRLVSSVWKMSRSQVCRLSVAQGTSLALVALICGIVHHFANEMGLLANADATALIQQAHQGSFIPKIGQRKVRKLLGGETVFIDARFVRDFKAGHIDGAINVPVDANDVEHQKATAEIPRDADIVLYCQSSGCKFAEIVAIRLIEDGYSNISIFRGGWAEWIAKNGSPKEAAI